MLTHLSIQGLAIIESLSIDIAQGFNVITGETGAGKSILIKALSLLLGGKATPDAVRHGWDQATITGEFQLRAGHPALDVLTGLGISYEREGDDAFLILRRQITAKGRSQSWANDISLTTPPLRELGSHLVDVFAQHENQRLLDPNDHLRYLDAFLGEHVTRSEVTGLSSECDTIVSDLKNLLATFNAKDRNQDYLSFRLEELKKFNPSAEDFENVKRVTEGAEKNAEFHETFSKTLSVLEGDGESQGAAALLNEAAKTLSRVTDAQTDGFRQRLLTAAGEVEDISFEIGRKLSSESFDEEELEDLQSRLFQYQDLFRKHGVKSVDDLMAEKTKLEAEFAFLENAAQTLQEKLGKLQKSTKALVNKAQALTEIRRGACKKIKNAIESELKELAMPGSTFETEFTPNKRAIPALDFSAFGEELVSTWNKTSALLGVIGDSGAEKCQFFLSANPGEPVLPLAKIASGGELSRIMLALKKSLAVDGDTCVLVFDEIDTGISGRVADVVGKKLRELSSEFQVICISHLPQVAVYADSHLLVKKVGKANRTESSIVRLSDEESAKEIARLLSGEKVSKPSLENAQALMARARQKPHKRSRPSA